MDFLFFKQKTAYDRGISDCSSDVCTSVLFEWRVAPGLTDYPAAVAAMEARVPAIREGRLPELVWLVEHPPLYTAGTSAAPDDLLQPDRFPVYRSGRGGEFTYHGPGQRVAYVMQIGRAHV